MNDTGGHDVGDTVLGLCWRATSRMGCAATASCAGWGGDEFPGICPQTPLDGAMRLAEGLRRGADAVRVMPPTSEWRASLTIGVAARAARHVELEQLMKADDEAMYESKKAGRNRVSAAG